MSRRWAVVVYDTRAEYGRFRTRRAAERLKAGLCSRTRGVVQMPWTVEVVDLSIDMGIEGGETKRSSESGNAENGSVPRAPGGAELEAKTAACAWGRMLFDASRCFLLSLSGAVLDWRRRSVRAGGTAGGTAPGLGTRLLWREGRASPEPVRTVLYGRAHDRLAARLRGGLDPRVRGAARVHLAQEPSRQPRVITWAHGFVTGWWLTTAALLVYIHRQDRAAARKAHGTQVTQVIETPAPTGIPCCEHCSCGKGQTAKAIHLAPCSQCSPRCGSFGCTLPTGHNMGKADVPENHSVGAVRQERILARLRCPCGGAWSPSSIDHGARWGIHVDQDGNPALPQPGCRLPDGTYMSGQTPSGSYIGLDGSVLD